jgi:rSAM/selenodomain-associated transferase 2
LCAGFPGDILVFIAFASTDAVKLKVKIIPGSRSFKSIGQFRAFFSGLLVNKDDVVRFFLIRENVRDGLSIRYCAEKNEKNAQHYSFHKYIIPLLVIETMPEYSIIIPALHEAKKIAGCIQRVRTLNSSVQVIVVDGGSDDQTTLIAEKSGVECIRSPAGRGVQCNEGAKKAKGDILIFLHADTLLPANAFMLLHDLFAESKVKIGTFRLRFDSEHWFLRLCGYFTRLDSILTRFGDQCIVVRRSFFDELGGFEEWPIFEDVDFLLRARKKTRIYSFPAEVLTSARKFTQNGPIRQQVKNGVLILKYLMGVCPEQLAREYKK